MNNFKTARNSNVNLTWLKSLFFSGVLLIFSMMIHAAPAITSDNAKPHYSSFTNEETFEDIRLKVLGGHVRMTRRWNGSTWVWNSRWNDLSVDKGRTLFQAQEAWVNSSAGETTTSPVDAFAANPPFVIYRAGQVYRKIPSETDQITYENQLRQFIKVHNTGYSWSDSKGNGIEFDSYGRIVSYYDRNNIYVYIERDRDGYINQIKDHHQNVVLTYAWEPLAGGVEKKNLYGEIFTPKRLSSLTDYTGRKVEYRWNNADQLTEIIDVLGNTWQFVYNDKGELIQQIDPEDRTTTYEIAISGHFISRFNHDGVGVSYTYSYDKDKEEYYVAEKESSGLINETWFDAMGNVIRRNSNGEEQSKTSVILSDNSLGPMNLIKVYSSSAVHWYRGNKLVRIDEPVYLPPQSQSSNPIYIKYETTVDARGNKTTREYNQWKNEISVTYPDGSRILRTWNTAYGLPLTVRNEKGVVTEYEYDGNGNLLTLTEAKNTDDQRTTRFTYDEYGQVKTKTTGESVANNTLLATTYYDYDAYGNITRIVNPMGYIILLQDYDALGNAEKIIDARANAQALVQPYSWTQIFDAAGNLLTDFNPYGKGQSYSYNKVGDLQTITEENGSVTTLTSNAAGLPVSVQDQNEHITRFEYDSNNRLIALTDANGNQNSMAYDIRGRLVTMVDGETNTTRYEYAHNLLSKVQYPGFSETLVYDNRDRIKETRQQANSRIYLRKSDYDLSGSLNGSTDANANSENYEYDKLNRLIKIVDAEGGITNFVYDARNNLLEVKDQEERITTYQYDLNDRLISETLAGGQRHYGYDESGNLVSHITPAGEKTAYEYDQAGQLVSKKIYATTGSTQPIKVISYNINAHGQYAGYSQGTGSTPEGNAVPGITPDIIPLSETYTYTALNQVESVTVNFGAFTKSYSYTYYPNGLKHTYTNPEGVTYTYYYNKNNQLTAVHIPGNGQLTYSNFQWLAPQTLLLPGGNRITLKYNDFLQVEERILKDSANNEITKALYQYDLESNINQIISEYGTYRFGYDKLYRLTQAEYPAGVAANDETFNYDGVGNRTEHSVGSSEEENAHIVTSLSYNNHNQLIERTTENGTAIFTYNANGHTATKTESGKATEYIYNHEERLIAVIINGQTVGEYAYNPNGMRINKTVNGNTTYYLYNENGLAAEYNSAGSLIKEYHFHPQKTWMTDPLFQRTQTNQIYYYQNDHLGTPQQMLASNGAVVWQANYMAFGEADILIHTVENNLRFPGQYFDGETKLHYNYFRDYDPAIGRYIQSDPIGLGGGINNYGYAAQNALIYIDPDGRLFFLAPAVMGAIAGALSGWDPCKSLSDQLGDLILNAALGGIGGAFPFASIGASISLAAATSFAASMSNSSDSLSMATSAGTSVAIGVVTGSTSKAFKDGFGANGYGSSTSKLAGAFFGGAAGFTLSMVNLVGNNLDQGGGQCCQ